MSTSALVTMIVMLCLFWGGFVTLLVVALRQPSLPGDEEEGAEAITETAAPSTFDDPPD